MPDFHECVTREEFVAQLLAVVEPAKLEVERIPLEQAAGRILAEDIVSRNTMPVCRQAPMDSVGLKSAMFADGTPDASNCVLGQDYVRADMGDDFPDEFDCVMGIEGVELLDNGGLKFVGEPHLVGKEGIPPARFHPAGGRGRGEGRRPPKRAAVGRHRLGRRADRAGVPQVARPVHPHG